MIPKNNLMKKFNHSLTYILVIKIIINPEKASGRDLD